jgi:hypothetical protein
MRNAIRNTAIYAGLEAGLIGAAVVGFVALVGRWLA